MAGAHQAAPAAAGGQLARRACAAACADAALPRAQTAHGVLQGAGTFGVSSRAVYAKARRRARSARSARGLAHWDIAAHGALTRVACATAALCLSRGAQKHGLPQPESGRVFPDTAGEESKTCIDVCAEFAGQQDCQTRCVRRAAAPRAQQRSHALRTRPRPQQQD